MEHTEWVEPETIPGSIAPFIGDKEEGAERFRKHIDALVELVLWTGGSRLNSGGTGASVVWHIYASKIRKTYLDTNKEVFDEEIYVMGEALGVVLQVGRTGRGASRLRTELP